MDISKQDPLEANCPDIASSTDDYATRFSGKMGAWFLKVQRVATLRLLAPYASRGIRVLDVGGGHAQSVGFLMEANHQVTITGSDANCAHRLRPYLNPEFGASFLLCPLTAIPVEDGAYEVALSYRMMAHLDHWPVFVAELCRVANDRVIVDYPTYRSFNCLSACLFKLKKGVERNTREFLIFHEKDICREFEKHGFVLEKRIGQYVMPMAIHRAHKYVPLAAFVEGICRLLGLSWLLGSPVIASFRRAERVGEGA